MTRLELIKILVGQARSNGFEFRRWFTTRLALPWENADAAFDRLDHNRHYYALLFSHDFARAFWSPGHPITFEVPARTFQRRMADGSVGTVQRKAFVRRSSRADSWRYHLRQMALAEEPLRYMRKYLRVEEELEEALSGPSAQPGTPSDTRPVPPTLALARKNHERRKLELTAKPITKPGKRGPRLPGSRTKST